MINGAHVVVYSQDAEADRGFFATPSVSHPWMPVAAG